MEDIYAKLRAATVGIAGCGGLGSNCAVSLARVGIGKLIIADFDTVDRSNLNRQYFFFDQIGRKKVYALRENILRIDPGVQVEVHDLRINEENVLSIFGKCDVIVEAFDRGEEKMMLVETVLERLPDKQIVTAVGLAGWGGNNTLRMRRSGNLYICGDEVSETSASLPPLGPRVGIVANMEANQVLEILLGEVKADKGDEA
jgi:sulfur carrier protein ThiS adenylyltransferase